VGSLSTRYWSQCCSKIAQ